MSKCILDIKFDITDTARDLAMDNGGFTYIHGERDSLRITDNTLAELSAKMPLEKCYSLQAMEIEQPTSSVHLMSLLRSI
jgi:hypothetical protein